ncbi:hypothetical protein K7459_27215 [Pseudomonas fluorescens]|uniref:Uncharacterized protein n=1 Tax=Pseudomonas fluorescens (strain Pf0-1) TaxID=205922 RepID=Q3KG07_PSEPF|nr:hypothetical protein [Pseudomonas fluorescens]ABA73299.1 conserved hypothetical protein [Pseudomonas fluorescens Pf0-1]MBY9027351.1 hypothetical protein [Pseudomonas fluorescens]MBY9032622.1 hypothetical protein [Pseudomonas fluorescens]MBY9039075.1 hypothetical protein [Pseudomonas fluorescens]MBY9044804.1 hypothetical protein [Pseudomonas fluorescens]
MTTSTPPDNTVFVLYPPIVNGQTTPVEGAHIGVPLVAYDLVTDGEGAVVLVDPPSTGTMDPGDVMELWLEGEPAALDSETIVDPNARTTLRIPKGRLHPDRVNKLYYTIRRGSSNLGTSTPPLEILYNRIRPGLKDRLTDPGGHSELKLLLSDAIKNGVGPDFVSAEVCVAYPYCRAYDLITLKCNGELLEPKPKVNPNQAPQPPNPGDEIPITICFTITRAYLDKAKRQDKKLHFSYTVTDQLGNGPDTDAPWSPVQSVDEDLDGVLLPMPILLERKEDYPGDDASIIDLEKLAGNPLLLVVITKDNRFVVGDEIVATYTTTGQSDPVVVRGKVEEDPFTGKLPCFLEVPNDKVFAGSKVTATYELRRSNGDLVGSSNTAKAFVIGIGQLSVAGNRSQTSPRYHSNLSRLTASSLASKGVSTATEVKWTYAGDTEGVQGRTFLDTEPERTLIVSLQDEEHIIARTVLRPGNVSGIFNLRNHHSGCIVKNDGSVFGWSENKEMLPPPGLKDVRYVTAGGHAYVALKNDDTVAAWGDASRGGSIAPEIDKELRDVKKLAATDGAFLALRNDGQLVAWGHPDYGSAIPTSVISQLSPVDKIIGNTGDFTALLRDGRVCSWGASWPDGFWVSDARGAIQLCASDRAFCALKSDRRVAAWGSPEHGGVISDNVQNSTEEVVLIASTSAAFAALKSDGSVAVWGNQRFGGKAPDHLHSVSHLIGSTTAFCAMTADGSLITWGVPEEGGQVPSGLSPALAISSSYGSFSAVLNTRRAVTWGVNTSAATLESIVCVYAAGQHVVLLNADSQLLSAGPNAPDLAALSGLVSYSE